MSINKKLNEDYFRTKNRHKQFRSKKKFTFFRLLRNLIITFILIYLFNLFRSILSEKIEENKKNDIEQMNKTKITINHFEKIDKKE